MDGEPPPPRSALTLRLVLAVFGLLLMTAATILAIGFGLPAGWIIAFAVLGLIAVVDLVVVVRRRRSGG